MTVKYNKIQILRIYHNIPIFGVGGREKTLNEWCS